MSRKSQAKKVVCIPAPAAANSRPTGEVVPSDLWAWRKYGQKPIKGSPYPRLVISVSLLQSYYVLVIVIFDNMQKVSRTKAKAAIWIFH